MGDWKKAGTLIYLVYHHRWLKEGGNFIQSITTGDWKKVGTSIFMFSLSPQVTLKEGEVPTNTEMSPWVLLSITTTERPCFHTQKPTVQTCTCCTTMTGPHAETQKEKSVWLRKRTQISHALYFAEFFIPLLVFRNCSNVKWNCRWASTLNVPQHSGTCLPTSGGCSHLKGTPSQSARGISNWIFNVLSTAQGHWVRTKCTFQTLFSHVNLSSKLCSTIINPYTNTYQNIKTQMTEVFLKLVCSILPLFKRKKPIYS